MEKQTIGKFIAALRKVNGMTQSELAERLSVTNKSVSKWERDECYPDLTLIPLIAEIFNVTSDEILKGARITNTAAADPDTVKSESPKTEKQISRLIQKAILNFRQLSFIAFSTGLIALFILFIGMETAIDGVSFVIFAVSFLGIVLQIMFSNRARAALFSIDDEVMSDKRLLRAARTIERYNFNIVLMNAVSVSAIILLYATTIFNRLNSHECSLAFKNFMYINLICYILAVYICAYVIKTLVTDKKYYDIPEDEKAKLKKLNIICCAVAAVFLTVSAVLIILSFILPNLPVVFLSTIDELYASTLKINLLFLLSLITLFFPIITTGTVHIAVRRKLLKPYGKLDSMNIR